MNLKAALCQQDFMAKEIHKSGDLSLRTITEEILLSAQRKALFLQWSEIQGKKKNPTVQFLQWNSEAAILVYMTLVTASLEKFQTISSII